MVEKKKARVDRRWKFKLIMSAKTSAFLVETSTRSLKANLTLTLLCDPKLSLVRLTIPTRLSTYVPQEKPDFSEIIVRVTAQTMYLKVKMAASLFEFSYTAAKPCQVGMYVLILSITASWLVNMIYSS